MDMVSVLEERLCVSYAMGILTGLFMRPFVDIIHGTQNLIHPAIVHKCRLPLYDPGKPDGGAEASHTPTVAAKP